MSFDPKIIAICCRFCAYNAADLAGSMRLQYPDNIRIILVPCTGKTDIQYILTSLESGADGVMIAGCLEGNCHFETGNIRARLRTKRAKELLEQIGFEPERVEMYNLSAGMGTYFAQIAGEFTERIRKLGPAMGPRTPVPEATTTLEERT
jgi:F420-non-reducing hydrogenase iron-sulfur subunit